MANKRGSHVGMMLSFAIFITFIIFIYSVVQPVIKVGEDKTAILNSIQTGIIKNTSLNLTTASMQIENPNPGQNCVIFQGFLLGMSDSTPDYYNAIAKSESGIFQPSYENLYDLKIDRVDKKNEFFRVYFSSNFTRLTKKEFTTCNTLEEEIGYRVGSVTIDNYMFERKIAQLAKLYNENYEGLKEDLKIPERNNFWFNFTKSDGTSISPTEKEAKTTDVFSSEIPIQYVTPDAFVQSGFINIRVW